MHVFFESVWKLHIGEIPEKPDFNDYSETQVFTLVFNNDMEAYNESIAAIKQNALMVGNPEIIKKEVSIREWYHDNQPVPDRFYFWPGGYETKEVREPIVSDYDLSSGRVPMGSRILKSQTVAILTLPEEKKNTMEISEFKCMSCGTSINEGEYETFGVCDACYDANYKKQTASGSVAAPKEEDESRNKLLSLGDKHFIIDEMTALREALKELLPIAEQYRTKIDNPNWEDDFNKSKAIIEKARKLILK